MATTTPDDIWTPDAGDNYALTTDLAAMADTVQDAITDVRSNGSYRAGLEANRTSTPNQFDGLIYFSTDTGKTWRKSGSDWLPATSGLVLIQTVSFTAASTVSFTGFTSQFDNYQVVLDINTSSGLAGGTIRMRSGGTDNSAAQYSAQQQSDTGSAHGGTMASGLTSFPFTPVTGIEHSSVIQFFGPATGRPTRVAFDTQTWSAPTAATKSTVAGRHNVSSAFDGFTYLPSGGATVTGTMSVYGFAK